MREVNALNYEDFIQRFGSVLEHGTLAAASVWSSRPFPDAFALHGAFKAFLSSSLSAQAREGVVRCYPDLAGRLTEEQRLTGESLREHKAAGLLELTDEEKAELGVLNSHYKEKFSFPFVICARENKKQAIMSGMRTRLQNSRSEELENALTEISKIAKHRIDELVTEKEVSLTPAKM